MTLLVELLSPVARLPERQHILDIGYDLFVADVRDSGDGTVCIDFGIAVEPPVGYHVELFSRSSIYKSGLVMANGVGLIDPGYRGPIKMMCYRVKPGPLPKVGERFGQLVLRQSEILPLREAKLSNTDRGSGGFGSTGTK